MRWFAVKYNHLILQKEHDHEASHCLRPARVGILYGKTAGALCEGGRGAPDPAGGHSLSRPAQRPAGALRAEGGPCHAQSACGGDPLRARKLRLRGRSDGAGFPGAGRLWLPAAGGKGGLSDAWACDQQGASAVVPKGRYPAARAYAYPRV